jgi:hypothetical protein
VHRRTAVPVWLDEEQIPSGAERIDLDLVVRVRVAAGSRKTLSQRTFICVA